MIFRTRAPYKDVEMKGSKMIVTFEHVGAGLYCFDTREPVGFAICGKDQNLYGPTPN